MYCTYLFVCVKVCEDGYDEGLVLNLDGLREGLLDGGVHVASRLLRRRGEELDQLLHHEEGLRVLHHGPHDLLAVFLVLKE